MELELGLALPTSPANDFDLNSHVSESPPSSSSASSLFSHRSDGTSTMKKKRGFVEAFEPTCPRTLPLLLWNNQPNGDDGDNGDDGGVDDDPSRVPKRNDGGNYIVGWPPIKFRRKRICSGSTNSTVPRNGGAAVGGGGGGPPNYKYVKVKMEGVGIGRKVDLSRHHSYQTLTVALINMFGKCQQDVERFKLAYQDREGDWLLAGDVPWRAFIQTVERLKLVKTGG